MIARSSSWLLAPLALLLASASCGVEDGTLPLGLDVRLSNLEGEEELQFIMLANRDRGGNDVVCDDVLGSCIGDQPHLRVLPLDTPSGTSCAFRHPLDLDAASSTDGQPVRIPGIPPGSGYLLVVEVVQKAGHREERIGAGCLPVDRIDRGSNTPPASPLNIHGASACLPRIDDC